MAVGQSPEMLAGLALSRASPNASQLSLFVGASLLAMDVNDNEGCLDERGALALIASRLNWPNDPGHLLRAI